MGLFSKEVCFNCGNKVGALSRIKLKSGEFLCTDCQKLGNPFIHIAYLTRDQAEALLREAKENEAHYQQVRFNFRKTSRIFRPVNSCSKRRKPKTIRTISSIK